MTFSNEKRPQIEELLIEIQTHTTELADEIRLLLREKLAASGLKS